VLVFGKIQVIENVIRCIIREKNDFPEISENLTSYKSENNFVWIIKTIM